MTIKIYDLGDASECDDEEIAQRIIRILEATKAYKSTHFYRGITADPAMLRHIQKYGTDRKQKDLAESIAIAHERIKETGDRYRKCDVVREAKILGDPTKIWAAPESKLVEIIHDYALPDPDLPDTFPLVLVYRSELLIKSKQGPPNLYSFNKGIKPSDALVAGFRF